MYWAYLSKALKASGGVNNDNNTAAAAVSAAEAGCVVDGAVTEVWTCDVRTLRVSRRAL